jgi:hypothetical protein
LYYKQYSIIFNHNRSKISITSVAMASNDPGLAQMGAEANEPIKGAILGSIDLEEAERPVAPDQLDERFETSRWEIW